MNLSRLLLLWIAMVVISENLGLSQIPDPDLRNVNLTNGDSIVKTSIRIKTDKKKVHSDYTYYWYNAGNINHNVGGFSGKLLHGKYEVFDNKQKLIVQGTFEYGIMTDSWTLWYVNGNVKFTGDYKDGMLSGIAKTYTDEGKLKAIFNYRKGLLDGKSYFYFNDTVITKKYDAGKEIIKLPKTTSKKKESDNIKPSINNKIKTYDNNKKWWSFFLSKKKESAKVDQPTQIKKQGNIPKNETQANKTQANKTQANETQANKTQANNKKLSSTSKEDEVQVAKDESKKPNRFLFLKKKSGAIKN